MKRLRLNRFICALTLLFITCGAMTAQAAATHDVVGPWNGAQFWTDDWRTATVDTPRAEETIQFLQQFMSDVYGTKKVHDTHNTAANFYAGGLGFWFTNNSAFGALKSEKVNWGVSLAPVNEKDANNKPIGTVASSWAYAMPANIPAAKQEAAWELLKWLTVRLKSGGWFNRVQGRPSPVISFNGHPDYFRENPQWSVVINAVNHDIPTPPTIDMAVLRKATNSVISQGLNIKQALVDAQRELQYTLDTYWSVVR